MWSIQRIHEGCFCIAFICYYVLLKLPPYTPLHSIHPCCLVIHSFVHTPLSSVLKHVSQFREIAAVAAMAASDNSTQNMNEINYVRYTWMWMWMWMRVQDITKKCGSWGTIKINKRTQTTPAKFAEKEQRDGAGSKCTRKMCPSKFALNNTHKHTHSNRPQYTWYVLFYFLLMLTFTFIPEICQCECDCVVTEEKKKCFFGPFPFEKNHKNKWKTKTYKMPTDDDDNNAFTHSTRSREFNILTCTLYACKN